MKNFVFYLFYSLLFYYLIRGSCVQQKGPIGSNQPTKNMKFWAKKEYGRLVAAAAVNASILVVCFKCTQRDYGWILCIPEIYCPSFHPVYINISIRFFIILTKTGNYYVFFVSECLVFIKPYENHPSMYV